MNTSDFGRCALSFCAGVVFIAGCAGNTALSFPPAGPTPGRAHAHPLYGVIYNFKGGKTDGYFPSAGLISVHGSLYGTTFYGGGTGCHKNGCGTMYAITASGESVLHRFGAAGDGKTPSAGLAQTNGKLYSTTSAGGTSDEGTAFAITTSGRETVLNSFKGNKGTDPTSSLLNVDGVFYGTTAGGGNTGCFKNEGCGTVFKITRSGKETVLHKFSGGSDGATPLGDLIAVGGTLYGTTLYGGGNYGSGNCPVGNGCGTVFAITKSGKERVVYGFQGGSDGAEPSAGLLNVDGTLYGTTCYGGQPGYAGAGTVFSITPSGSENVIYRFQGEYAGDGDCPNSSLIDVNGALYGTTPGGGAYHLYGTVFSVTTSGEETLLHSFNGKYGSGDGCYPEGGVVDVDGTLYGTTEIGGTTDSGTVYALSP